MRTRKQIEGDARPAKGAVLANQSVLLSLVLEVLLDIRERQPTYVGGTYEREEETT